MKLIEAFLPYKDLIPFTYKSFAPLFIIILILIFSWFIIVQLRLTFRVLRAIPKNSQDLTETNFNKNKYLSPVWIDYKNSFRKFDNLEKTEELAENFFNQTNILGASANLKLLSSGPSIFVGLGILGTFIGLTLGISDFEMENTETIKSSITVLLGGMATAFSTSIWGMLLSVIYTFIEKWYSNKLSNKLHSLSYSLDQKYRATSEHKSIAESIVRREVLLEVFSYQKEDGSKVRPGNILRDLHKESEQQTAALKEFSTDLATKIEFGFDELLNDQKENIAPLLEMLGDKIDSLATKLNDPAKEMTEGVISDLKVAIESMVADLKSSVSESTKNEMEGIAKGLQDASKMLESVPDLIQSLNSNIKSDLDSLSERTRETIDQLGRKSNEAEERWEQQQKIIIETLRTSVEKTEAETEKNIQKLSENSKNFIEELMSSQSKVVNDLAASIESLQDNQKQLILDADQSICSTGKTIQEFDVLLNKFSESTIQVNQSLELLNSVNQKLQNTSNSFQSIAELSNDSTKQLNNAQSSFVRSLESAEGNYKRTIDQIMEAMDSAKSLSKEFTGDFSSIEEALGKIFEKIQSGLLNYEKTVRESTKNYLEEYTNGLVNSTNAISNTVSQQKDSLEDLKELFDDLIVGLKK